MAFNIYEAAAKDLAARIDKTVECATEADKRAYTIAGTFIVLATAILGVVSRLPKDTDIKLTAISLVVAVGFYISAFLCILASSPRVFHVSNSPAGVWDALMAAEASQLDVNFNIYGQLKTKLDANEKSLGRRAKLLSVGLFGGVFFPLGGAIIYLFWQFCHCS